MIVEKVSDFLICYDGLILSLLLLSVWLFGAINWCNNVYRKQNKKFLYCMRNIYKDGNAIWFYLAALPKEYRRQWRAFTNSKAQKPSDVFEFVPRKNKIIFVHFFVLCALVSSGYLALFILNTAHRDYAIFQAAFWLSFALVMVAKKCCFDSNEKNARKIFGRFVVALNNAQKTDVPLLPQNAARKIDQIKKDLSDKSLSEASELLRRTSDQRTVDQQRELNVALNGLLQAYARSANLVR